MLVRDRVAQNGGGGRASRIPLGIPLGIPPGRGGGGRTSAAGGGAAAATTDESNPTLDPAFLQSVLGSLPGVDPNDPRIQSVLQSMPPPDKKDDEKKEGDK